MDVISWRPLFAVSETADFLQSGGAIIATSPNKQTVRLIWSVGSVRYGILMKRHLKLYETIFLTIYLYTKRNVANDTTYHMANEQHTGLRTTWFVSLQRLYGVQW
jgi:hypothetical protein